MSHTSVNFRMEEEDKIKFENICKEIGLNMSSAFAVFTKAVIREQGIPFEVSMKIPNAKTIKAMEETEEMLENPSRYKSYTSFNDAINDMELNDEI